MTEIRNPLQACVQIFAKPRAVFDAVNQHNNWSWIPFIAVLIFSLSPTYLYFLNVDFAWYQDFVINTNAQNVSPAEQENMRALMNKDNILVFTVTIGFIMQVLVNAILAAYLYLACKSDENNANGFTEWYGFTWWVSLPAVIGFVAGLFMLYLTDSAQMPMGHLHPLALSFWLGLDDSSNWFAITNVIRPETFLSIYLIAVGVSRWTEFESKRVYTIAFAPFAVLMSVWLLMLLL